MIVFVEVRVENGKMEGVPRGPRKHLGVMN
jgi:hypothetical protein